MRMMNVFVSSTQRIVADESRRRRAVGVAEKRRRRLPNVSVWLRLIDS